MGAVRQGLSQRVEADFVRQIVGQRSRRSIRSVVPFNSNDLSRLRGGQCHGNIVVGTCDRTGIGGGRRIGLVHKEHVRGRLSLEPEIVIAPCLIRLVAIQRHARGVHQRGADSRSKVHTQLVRALRSPARAAVFDIGVVARIAARTHANPIIAGGHRNVDGRVLAEIGVVLRDELIDCARNVSAVIEDVNLLVDAQHRVQLAGVREPLSNRFRREGSRLGHGKAVHVDIGTLGPIQVLQVHDIPRAWVDRLGRVVEGEVRGVELRTVDVGQGSCRLDGGILTRRAFPGGSSYAIPEPQGSAEFRDTRPGTKSPHTSHPRFRPR